MYSRCISLLCEGSSTSRSKRPFPRMYFDLKAFRKGLSEKKNALIEAEKKEIHRAYAKQPPEGWTVKTFLEKTNVADLSKDGPIGRDQANKFYEELASLFEDWSDLVSSSRKDLYRISHMLNAKQHKKLAYYIDLFNHDLFPLKVEPRDSNHPLYKTKPAKPWTELDDLKLIELATEKYDYKFGDPWLYVSVEMDRTTDDVEQRFNEIYVKPQNKTKKCEIALTKSYRPLLMNRQFRLLPPQCYIIPSAQNFPSPSAKFEVSSAFEQYLSKDS